MSDSRSMHLVDPAHRDLLAAWPSETLSAANLAAVRSREARLPSIDPTGTSVSDHVVPGPAGAPSIGLRIICPDERGPACGCIYRVHGGGFVIGSAQDAEFLYRPLAAALGCYIVSVEYRLAPEAVFPAAIEDCYAGLAWTFANAERLGIDPTRIGVMGESAGGGLAAALALLARDRGEFRLAFQHMTYPMLDDRTCVRPAHPVAGEFIWTHESNRFGWASLLGHEPGGENVSFYAAAARAENLADLPATFILSGALDLFVDENVEYARRLIRAGVPTELHVHPGGFHGFDFIPGTPVADQAREERLAALRRALSPAAR